MVITVLKSGSIGKAAGRISGQEHAEKLYREKILIIKIISVDFPVKRGSGLV